MIRKLVLTVGLALLLPAIVLAGQAKKKAAVSDPPVKPQAQFAVGFGSFFGEEDVAFNPDALFAAIHWYGLSLPLPEGSTGIGVELGYGTLEGNTSYSLWNLNRMDIVPKRIFGGLDMKFAQSAGGTFTADFDARMVVGAWLGKVGKGNFALEIYSLEENRPIAFLVKYRF